MGGWDVIDWRAGACWCSCHLKGTLASQRHFRVGPGIPSRKRWGRGSCGGCPGKQSRLGLPPSAQPHTAVTKGRCLGSLWENGGTGRIGWAEEAQAQLWWGRGGPMLGQGTWSAAWGCAGRIPRATPPTLVEEPVPNLCVQRKPESPATLSSWGRSQAACCLRDLGPAHTQEVGQLEAAQAHFRASSLRRGAGLQVLGLPPVSLPTPIPLEPAIPFFPKRNCSWT